MRREDGATGMSRRRKHADSPARRSTPRTPHAESRCSAVEPEPRSCRAARDSRLCRAGARLQRREQRRAEAEGGRSPGGEDGAGGEVCRAGRLGLRSAVPRAGSDSLVLGGLCSLDLTGTRAPAPTRVFVFAIVCFAERPSSACSRNLLGATSG